MGKGILILIPTKDDRKDINNYRPIVLLPVIYKVWADIIDNRLSPIMNIIMNIFGNELHRAYKKPIRKRHNLLH